MVDSREQKLCQFSQCLNPAVHPCCCDTESKTECVRRVIANFFLFWPKQSPTCHVHAATSLPASHHPLQTLGPLQDTGGNPEGQRELLVNIYDARYLYIWGRNSQAGPLSVVPACVGGGGDKRGGCARYIPRCAGHWLSIQLCSVGIILSNVWGGEGLRASRAYLLAWTHPELTLTRRKCLSHLPSEGSDAPKGFLLYMSHPAPRYNPITHNTQPSNSISSFQEWTYSNTPRNTL